MWNEFSNIISHIAVYPGALRDVASWVSSKGHERVLLVSDINTYAVAGNVVTDDLEKAHIEVVNCCFPQSELLPDEAAIGYLTAAYTDDISLILGVGSGTINDICTFVAAKVGSVTAIVGTAASMDGYASLGSAMLQGGVKVTPPTIVPVAIFCDIDILSKAPQKMTVAGLGDMLGKHTALADWKLSHILTNEDMPEHIARIVDRALQKISSAVRKLSADKADITCLSEKDVVLSITEGLILSGIAMSMYGDSRPASGTEHHIAHFFEMRILSCGKKPALHGAEVGVATIVSLIMWKELLRLKSEDIQSLINGNFSGGKRDSDESYADNIKKLYGTSAEKILQSENPVLPAEVIAEKWQEVLNIAETLPQPEEIAAILSSVNAPVTPVQIGVSECLLRNAINYSKDRKKTVTLMQLLSRLGLLDDYAGIVVDYFSKRVLKDIKCFVMDLDGTVYLGDKVFSFSRAFFDKLGEYGIDYVFFTNNSSKNADFYINKLQKLNIPVSSDKLLMSTHVLLSYLGRSDGKIGVYKEDGSMGNRVFVAGTNELKSDFESAGYELTETDPDFVVLGFDTDIYYERLVKLCDFVRSGIPYFGVNMDYNCPVEGGFIPDCGAIASLVMASTGRMPEFFGKPSSRAVDYIAEKTGYKEEELCFVGDRLYTDIAITDGRKSRSILVLSGETKRSDLKECEYVPDLVFNDISEIVQHI